MLGRSVPQELPSNFWGVLPARRRQHGQAEALWRERVGRCPTRTAQGNRRG